MAEYNVHKAVDRKHVWKTHVVDQERIDATYLVQPKYDGVNIKIIVNALDAECVRVETRTGQTITSMAHVVDSLLKFPGIKPGVYFGESWAPGKPQAKISGATVKGTPAPWLQFVVFDYLTIEEFAAERSDLGYSARVERLPEPFFRILVDETTPVWPAVCEGTLADCGLTAEEAALQYVKLGGYDGIILRDPYGRWVMDGDGRGGEILKVKPLLTLDLLCIGYEPGKGKHEGRIGTLVVEFNGKRQGAGTGLKDSERDYHYFKKNFENNIVEIECLGYTEDGMLREPRFKGVRFDKVSTDG